MRRWIILGCLVASLWAHDGRIATTEGFVQGRQAGGTWAYLKIPYAAPPLGDLRWRPPQAPTPWTADLDATEWGPVCPQAASNGSPIGDEDCLHLNLWTPHPPPVAPVPVLFWIHGGGHVQGGAPQLEAGLRTYDGQRLAEKTQMVVVTINYRLGPLGFLAIPSLATSQGSAGNVGRLDQILALQWVRRNIGSFGGDPARVLIFGESAGGVSVCALMTAPAAAGLFHAAAIQSAACTARTQESAEAFALRFANAAGCPDPDPAACLRGKTPEELLRALPTNFNIATESGNYGSVVDGVVHPRPPLEMIQRREHQAVPLILGANSDETSRSVPNIRTEAEYIAATRAAIPQAALAAAVLQMYPASDYPSPRAAFVAWTSDARFVCPAYRTARLITQNQSPPVFRYFMTHVPETASPEVRAQGAWHGLDVLYVFDALDRIPGYRPGPGDRQVADAFAAYWSQLAATGDPNRDGLHPWPPLQLTGPSLEIAVPLALQPNPRGSQCVFWDALALLATGSF
jgi:para-nitrobenzyl esterase